MYLNIFRFLFFKKIENIVKDFGLVVISRVGSNTEQIILENNILSENRVSFYSFLIGLRTTGLIL